MQKQLDHVPSLSFTILAEHSAVSNATLPSVRGRQCHARDHLAKAVFVLENHDEAFYIWQDAKVMQRALVHIDAHHDMWWISDQNNITIANFICPALKRDFISEVIWVVPTATFADSKSRKSVLAQVTALLKDYPVKSRKVVTKDDRITASLLGKKLTVCTLRSIPTLQKNVLLDIDVDYFVIPRVTYQKFDHHSLLPWCWPCELADSLRAFESDLITVVYSVQGGYTPLQWKYLADELALRLKQPNESGCRLQGMEQIRQGAEAEVCGDATQAELKYRVAMKLLPESAAPSYRLARLLMRLGRVQEARQLYEKAVGLDSSYRGAYSSAGFHFFWSRQFEAAEREFRDIQALNPEDPYAHLGLGLLAKKQKRWEDAEHYLEAALEMDECLIDAQHALADVLMKKGKKEEAVRAYERALKLGLMGHKPLCGPILTNTGPNRILDPLHCEVYARLAVLYEQNGATAKAVNALRISIAGGSDSVMSHLRLAFLYIKRRSWRNAVAELWQALRDLPKDVLKRWALLGQWLNATEAY